MEKTKATSSKKGIGGRKKLPAGKHLNKKLQIHVTEEENTQIENDFANSGLNSKSEYLRQRLLKPGRRSSSINPIELLKQIDKIGAELGSIGNNMNQIAKYANLLSLRGELNMHPIKQFNMLMDEYMSTRRELVKAYRAIIKNK